MIAFTEHKEDVAISVTQQGLASGVVVSDNSRVDVTNIAASVFNREISQTNRIV